MPVDGDGCAGYPIGDPSSGRTEQLQELRVSRTSSSNSMQRGSGDW